MIFTQQITRLRARERTNRAGDTVLDWDSPDTAVIDRLSVQPASQTEDTSNLGAETQTGYRIISAPGHTPDLRAADRIEFHGQTYEITGEVAYWPDPCGLDHIEARMTRYGGTL